MQQVHNSEVVIFCWNRKNENIMEDFIYSFNENSEYGNKKKYLFGFLHFKKNAREFIKKYSPDYIHSIDISMLLVASKLKREYKIIYEVYDIKFLRSSFVNKIRELIEVNLINKGVESIVYASPFFDIYYKKLGVHKEHTIINNKPNKLVLNLQSDYMNKYREGLKDKLVIGFVGNIRHKEILMNLISAAAPYKDVCILLSGDGASLKDIVQEVKLNNYNLNVVHTGRYDVKDLNSIYSCCNYIWAAYPNKNINVKYAVSNKYYESIAYKRKIIVSEKTYLSEEVILNNIGYFVNPYDREMISELILNLKKNYISDEFPDVKPTFWEDDARNLCEVYTL
ncbi:hypothetical protein [Paenibacillus sp. PastF-3]|uniref:glycosyltransferase n=1 Tax=Paenibacillus sp. PastF-3 TaxID=2940626 RepID=UPI0024737DED|nr:hypothetical protein [Paenibacillus sp. PastF-3]